MNGLILKHAVVDADSVYRQPIVHVESADTSLRFVRMEQVEADPPIRALGYKGRKAFSYGVPWYRTVRRWRFVTQSGDVYVIADTTGAMPQRRGSIWGPR